MMLIKYLDAECIFITNMITLKTKDQINMMDEANKIVHHVLDYAEANIEIGMSSNELDALMEQQLGLFGGATSAFKNYMGYPKVSCISVNSVVVHGIPNDVPFKSGDIVSIDFGVYYKGFAGDAAKTFILGEAKCKEDEQIVGETKRALFAGIEQMIVGNRLHDIGHHIDEIAKQNQYGNVRNFCGHGIGTKMHESPSVFNYVEPKEPNIRLQEGLVLALEPMFTLGKKDVHILEDNWTVDTVDKSNAVHWELSVAITNEGPRILGK